MTDNAASQPLAPTARRIADALRHDILAGVLAPGTRIRQEDYSAHFGASRIPVREALKALQSEGLLTLQANRGAWVAHMNQAQCLEIYKIRERIEPLALSESTQRMPAAAMDGLEALVERMEQVTTVEAFIPLDREFHLRSYEYSSLPELNAMIVRYWNTTQQYRRAYMNEVGFSLRTIVDSEHRLLMDAIRRRDSYNAERLLQVHIRRTRLEFERTKLPWLVRCNARAPWTEGMRSWSDCRGCAVWNMSVLPCRILKRPPVSSSMSSGANMSIPSVRSGLLTTGWQRT